MRNWSNNWWLRRNGQSILRVISACGRTWSHSFRVNVVPDLHVPNTESSLNVCISCSILFYQISLVWTILHMKPVPVVFLFSDARESLSNMWIFYWKSCLVRKWANVVKAYIIYIPPPVIQWLWWYIDTVKIVEKSYLPIDFVIKNW